MDQRERLPADRELSTHGQWCTGDGTDLVGQRRIVLSLLQLSQLRQQRVDASLLQLNTQSTDCERLSD